jgi:hypothetical protein
MYMQILNQIAGAMLRPYWTLVNAMHVDEPAQGSTAVRLMVEATNISSKRGDVVLQQKDDHTSDSGART